MSNDNWIKGQEISTEVRKDKAGNASVLMENSRVCDFIADPHQKILYFSDYDANWSFFVELIKIIPQGDMMRNYPVCVKTVGDAPKQYLVVPAPKTIATEDDEFEKLLATDDDDVEDEAETSTTDGMMDEAEEVEESLSLVDKESDLIKKALKKHKGKRKLAAQELGISERTLYRKIKELEL
jgi:DNA-binding protein Fis